MAPDIRRHPATPRRSRPPARGTHGVTRPGAPRAGPRPRARRAAPGGSTSRRPAIRPRAGPGAIRWDRVGRAALLAVLGIVLLLYLSPLHRWILHSRTASSQRAEVRSLEREHARLAARVRELRRPDALGREARRLGMVKRGERPYVIQAPPAGP